MRLKYIGLGGIGVAMAITSSSAHAQVVPPTVQEVDDNRFAPSRTASEFAEDVRWMRLVVEEGAMPGEDGPSRDSIASAVGPRALRWLDTLRARPATGRQLEMMVRIALAAGDETLAQQQVAVRIATSRLPTADLARTYNIAVRAFADRDYPARLSVAERYIQRLDSLSSAAPDVAYWQFLAHLQLIKAYDGLGRDADALRHLRRALVSLRQVPFEFRPRLFDEINVKPLLFDLVLRQPNGRTVLDSLQQQLGAATVPPKSLVAINPRVPDLAAAIKNDVDAAVRNFGMIGELAPPIIGNVWVNHASIPLVASPAGDVPNAQLYRLGGNQVTLVFLGDAQSEDGMASLLFLQRLQTSLASTFPGGVQTVAGLTLRGTWGFRFIRPDTEAVRLTAFYRDTLRLTFPFVFTVQPKVRTREGGWQMAPEPSPAAYRFPLGNHWIWVVDQNGRIRKIYGGMRLTSDDRRDMTDYVTQLVRRRRSNIS